MKTKLKNIEAKFYQGKPNGFRVTLEDGTEGNLAEKDSDKDFKNGDEVEATVADYVSKAGKHSNLITLKHFVSETQQKSVETETKAEPAKPSENADAKKLKAEAAMRMMAKALDVFGKDGIDWDQVAARQEHVTRLLWSEIDEIYGLK